ncbi:MAG: EamA family transporter RarD [Rhodospirillaceae bacterium]|nr:EamA family transporter RarD [Rhodospirillaceae bacterium]
MQRGVVSSLIASGLFASLYYLAPALSPLVGREIFGWRVLLTLPFTTLLLLISGQWLTLVRLAQRVRRHPMLVPLLLLSSFLLGVQLWFFLWAPLNGRALPAALGFFLLPLAMVLAGRLLYRERLSRVQLWAAILASIGVAWEFGRSAGFSWEVAFVALGFTVYFTLRRHLRTNNLAGHWVDMMCMLPAAMFFILQRDSLGGLLQSHPKLYALLPLLGILSAVALALYMLAHRLLPLGLFGLLSYLEPVLLLMVALLLGERIATDQWPTYGFVMAAVALLALEAGIRFKHKPQ